MHGVEKRDQEAKADQHLKTSTQHALSVALRRRTIRTRKLIKSRDPESLRGRDALVFQAVWVSAVQDSDAHHGE